MVAHLSGCAAAPVRPQNVRLTRKIPVHIRLVICDHPPRSLREPDLAGSSSNPFLCRSPAPPPTIYLANGLRLFYSRLFYWLIGLPTDKTQVSYPNPQAAANLFCLLVDPSFSVSFSIDCDPGPFL